MENLLFSLNATVPLFATMLLGFLLRNTKVMADGFSDRLNTFVFRVLLPVQLFHSMYHVDIRSVWDGKAVSFCVAVTLISVVISVGLAFLLKDRSLRAEFAQAAYRSNQAFLGVALMQNLYGGVGSAMTLVLLGTVPVYNISAVVILTMMSPTEKIDRNTIWRSVKGIIRNPIILGIAAGMAWSLLKLPVPVALQRFTSSVASASAPMALIALGSTIDLKQVSGCVKEALACSMVKLCLFVGLFLPLAVYLGFRGEMLVAMLIMLGCSSAISCFTMARNMGYAGALSYSTVLFTNIGSAFTMSLALYVLRSLTLI